MLRQAARSFIRGFASFSERTNRRYQEQLFSPLSLTSDHLELKSRVLARPWGYLNAPYDQTVLIEALAQEFANCSHVVLCELGVATGATGNRMVELLNGLGIEKVQYFGIDNLALTNMTPAFEFPEQMNFLEGDRGRLVEIQLPIDFSLIDACHCAECVYFDSIAVSQRIRPHGLMAFHDTSLSSQGLASTVARSSRQHYASNRGGTRPLGVVEGIVMARPKWAGEWQLVMQEGDHLEWGGVRVYQRTR